MADLMIIFVMDFLQTEKQTKKKQWQQKYSICFLSDSGFHSLTYWRDWQDG